MHLPFNQSESPADAVVGSREILEVNQVVDFAVLINVHLVVLVGPFIVACWPNEWL